MKLTFNPQYNEKYVNETLKRSNEEKINEINVKIAKINDFLKKDKLLTTDNNVIKLYYDTILSQQNNEEIEDIKKNFIYENIINEELSNINILFGNNINIERENNGNSSIIKLLTLDSKSKNNEKLYKNDFEYYNKFYYLVETNIMTNFNKLKEQYFNKLMNLYKENNINESDKEILESVIKKINEDIQNYNDDDYKSKIYNIIKNINSINLEYEHQVYIITYYLVKNALISETQRTVDTYKEQITNIYNNVFQKFFMEDTIVNNSKYNNEDILLEIIDDLKTEQDEIIINFIKSKLILEKKENIITNILNKGLNNILKNCYLKRDVLYKNFYNILNKLIKKISEKKTELINELKNQINNKLQEIKNIKYVQEDFDSVSLKIYNSDIKYIYNNNNNMFNVVKHFKENIKDIDDSITEGDTLIKNHMFYLLYKDYLDNLAIGLTQIVDERIKNEEIERKKKEEEEYNLKLKAQDAIKQKIENDKKQLEQYKIHNNILFEQLKKSLIKLNEFYNNKDNKELVNISNSDIELNNIIYILKNIYISDNTEKIVDIHKNKIIANNYNCEYINEKDPYIFSKNFFNINDDDGVVSNKLINLTHYYFEIYNKFLDELIDNIFGAIRIVVNRNPSPPHPQQSIKKTDNASDKVKYDKVKYDKKIHAHIEFKNNYPLFEIINKINKNNNFELEGIKEYYDNDKNIFLNPDTPTFKYILEKLRIGNKIVICTYGQSGTGKTFSLFGDENTDGFLILLLKKLTDESFEYNINSAYEIYNNCSYQYKNDSDKKNTTDDFNYTKKKSFKSFKFVNMINNIIRLTHTLQNSIEKNKSNKLDNLYKLLKQIENNRFDKERIRGTPFNDKSSRSFLFLDINIFNRDKELSNLFIMDMAGIENQKTMLATMLEKIFPAKSSFIIPDSTIKTWIDDNKLAIDNVSVWENMNTWRILTHTKKLDYEYAKQIIKFGDFVYTDSNSVTADIGIHICLTALKLLNEGKFINNLIKAFNYIFKFKMNEKKYKNESIYDIKYKDLINNVSSVIPNSNSTITDIIEPYIIKKITNNNKDIRVLELLNVRDDITVPEHILEWFPLHTFVKNGQTFKGIIDMNKSNTDGAKEKTGSFEHKINEIDYVAFMVIIFITILVIIIIVILIIFNIINYKHNKKHYLKIYYPPIY
jgi:hypothetical protein